MPSRLDAAARRPQRADDDASLVRRLARISRHADGPSRHTLEDLTQAGWLALLEAQAAGRVPRHQPDRAAYLSVRLHGAMRDAKATDRRQHPAWWQPPDLGDGGVAGVAMIDPAPGPERTVIARQHLAAIWAAATAREREAICLTAQGYTQTEAGRQMGVDNSRVCQLLRAAGRRMG